MTFEINQKDAYAKLSKLNPFINQSAVIPILTSLRVIVYIDYALFNCSDLETFATVKIPIITTSKPKKNEEIIGDFVIDYKSLLHFLKTAENGETITIKTDDNHAFLISGGFKAKVVLENRDNYPVNPTLKDEELESIEFEQKELMPFLKNCVRFVSNDDLRPAMTGVYLHYTTTTMKIVATDAYRLYFKELKSINNKLLKTGLIIPAKPVRVLTQCQSSDKIFIQKDANRVRFTYGAFTITTRIIDARFPDYSVVITKLECGFYVKRKQLKAYLKMSIPFTNKATGELQFNITSEQLKIYGLDVDFRTGCYCSLPVYNASGITPFKTAFNLKLMADLLECSSDENVYIKTSMKPTQAVIIDECALIMPLIINDVHGNELPDWKE